MTANLLRYLVFLSVLVLAQVTASAQQNRTIEVVGQAEVGAMPDRVEITARLVAKGKTSKKALAAFQEKKGKFNTAVNPMNFSGVKISYAGPEVGPNTSEDQAAMVAMMGGDIAEVGADEMFSAKERIQMQLDLSDMEEDAITAMVAKLSDAVLENDADFGGVKPNPFGMQVSPDKKVVFVISDPESAIAACEEKAMQSAKRSAERLAKLAGGNVGKVISIKQVAGGTDDQESGMESMMMEMYGMSESGPQEFSSHSYGEIAVKRGLKVVFELGE